MGFTVPVAVVLLLPIGLWVIALRGPIIVLSPRIPVAMLLAILTVPIIQGLSGALPTRFDVGSYLPLLYAAAAFQIMSFVDVRSRTLLWGLMAGSVILAGFMAWSIFFANSIQDVIERDVVAAEERLNSSLAPSAPSPDLRMNDIAPAERAITSGSAVSDLDVGSSQLYRYKQSVVTPLGSSNYLALFFMVAFSAALFSRQYLWALGAAAAIFATMSRFGIALLIVPLVAFWVRTGVVAKHRRLIATAGVPLGLVLALTVYFSGLHTLGWQSIEVRFRLFESAFAPILDSWLIGQPRSRIVTHYEYPASWHPHNWLLWSFAFIGLLGTTLYVFYLSLVSRSLLRLRNDGTWAGIGVAMVTLLLWGMAEVVFMTPAISLLIASLGGLAYAQCTRKVKLKAGRLAAD